MKILQHQIIMGFMSITLYAADNSHLSTSSVSSSSSLNRYKRMSPSYSLHNEDSNPASKHQRTRISPPLQEAADISISTQDLDNIVYALDQQALALTRAVTTFLHQLDQLACTVEQTSMPQTESLAGTTTHEVDIIEYLAQEQ
jgi:hypothetical protein